MRSASPSVLRAAAIGMVVMWGAMACSTTPTSSPPAAKTPEQDSASSCRSAINEAVRLHNAAVELVNADRAELALNKFDQSILEWQRVTDGTLRCAPDAVTFANDGLQKTQFERDKVAGRQR